MLQQEIKRQVRVFRNENRNIKKAASVTGSLRIGDEGELSKCAFFGLTVLLALLAITGDGAFFLFFTIFFALLAIAQQSFFFFLAVFLALFAVTGNGAFLLFFTVFFALFAIAQQSFFLSCAFFIALFAVTCKSETCEGNEAKNGPDCFFDHIRMVVLLLSRRVNGIYPY